MPGTIILDQNNLSSTGTFNPVQNQAPYNTFSINTRGFRLAGRKIALRKMYLYYSFPNIITGTTVKISWKVGAAYVDFTWTLPAKTNYADVAELNAAFQAFCITNGLYLINGSNNVYYAQFIANANTYKIELDLFKVPTSLPVGFSEPTVFQGYPDVSCTPKIELFTGSELCNILGFAAGVYNGGTSDISYQSTYVPQFNPVSSVYITCNCAKNDIPINSSTVIGTFTTKGTPYGAMITIEVQSELDWYDIDTNTNLLTIQLWSQDWELLYCQDPQTMIQLSIK